MSLVLFFYNYCLTILAVSHQQLVSLWDPIEVVVKATVVGDGPNNVNFLRIVEPDILDFEGGYN